VNFETAAETHRSQITELRNRYLAGDREAIQVVLRETLQRSRYPTAFPRNIEAHYNAENRIALITLQLPDLQRIAILRDGKKIGQREKTQLHDSIALVTLYEVVASDEINAIDSVAFNGWVDFIDGATGQPRQACILSVHAMKAQITALNIVQVNPTECFTALKGLAAKRVSAYTPVAPILTLNKEDDRLIAGRPVIDGLSADDNLAAMDWTPSSTSFANCLRRSSPGPALKYESPELRAIGAWMLSCSTPTRCMEVSEKYANLVDVASVRDLLGTVQAESANRGYLVTTSHFGPDAHEFAKDKNITLIDGPHLLHLFEKHGYKFRGLARQGAKICRHAWGQLSTCRVGWLLDDARCVRRLGALDARR
jgi:restriction system protein